MLYLDRRRLKVRIHGRPRSDRKKRFLLSAVAPSTSTRHPRKASPSTGHSAVGLRQARSSLLNAEATFHRTIMDAWSPGDWCFGRRCLSSGAPSDSCVPSDQSMGMSTLALHANRSDIRNVVVSALRSPRLGSQRLRAARSSGSGTVAIPMAASLMPYGSTRVSAWTSAPQE